MVLTKAVGDIVNVSCLADGLPEPRVIWRRDGRVLSVQTGRRIEITTEIIVPGFRTQVPTQSTVLSTLMIRGILVSDNNTQLSCLAVNNIGEPATLTTPYTIAVVETRENIPS